MASDTNLVLVTVDCLRADRVGVNGSKKGLTPNIDQFGEEGTIFKQAVSNGPRTGDSFPAIFTSTYPLMNLGKRVPTEEKITLAEVLNRAGFKTSAIHSNAQLFACSTNYDRGFEDYEDFFSSSKKKKNLDKLKNYATKIFKYLNLLPAAQGGKTLLFGGAYEDAKLTTNTAIKWLEKNEKNGDDDPFFLWVHYMDPHGPFNPPSKYLDEPISKSKKVELWKIFKNNDDISEKKMQELFSLYEAEIRYVDDYIGNFFHKLQDMGLWNNSIVALTADHGEGFKEHGKFGHGSDLYEELTRVPLIIKSNKLNNQIIEDSFPLIDLSPTLLELMDIESPETFMGESKSWEKEDKATFSENRSRTRAAYRTSDWKFILKMDKGIKELYNLNQDPKEKENLVEIEPERSSKYQRKLENHLTKCEKKHIDMIIKDIFKR